MARIHSAHYADGRHFHVDQEVPDRITTNLSTELRMTEIDISSRDIPEWATRIAKALEEKKLFEDVDAEWVWGRQVAPHTDRGFDFDRTMFASLVVSVEPGSMFCQAVSATRNSDLHVAPGTFFVVDPRRLHWMTGENSQTVDVVVLQWKVNRRKAAQAVGVILGILEQEFDH